MAEESVLNQTQNLIEVIIYDYTLDDRTLKMLQAECKNNPLVRIIANDVHQNVAYATKRLPQHPGGEFVGLLDSDDILLPEGVDLCVKKFRSSPNVGIVCTDYEYINEKGEYLRDGMKRQNFDRQQIMCGNIFTHFRMFRSRDWNRSRQFNGQELNNHNYGEVWDLGLKIAEVTDFARVNKVLCQYHLRKDSVTNTLDVEDKTEKTLKIINSYLKHHGIARKAIVTNPTDDPHSIWAYLKNLGNFFAACSSNYTFAGAHRKN